MSTNRVTASRGKRTRARIQGALVYIYNNEKGFQDIRLVSLSFNSFIPRLKQLSFGVNFDTPYTISDGVASAIPKQRNV